MKFFKKTAIVVLSSSVKKNKKGNWVSLGFSKKDFSLGSVGGQIRILATKYLFEKKISNLIITSGGRGWDIKNDELTRQNLSKIIKDELIVLGIPKDKIIEENKSNKTFEQLIEIDKIIINLKLDQIFVITNDYHKKRVITMINFLKEIKNKDKIKVISAEDICLKYNFDKWSKIIKKVYLSNEMRNVIKREEQGVKDIKEGKYKLK